MGGGASHRGTGTATLKQNERYRGGGTTMRRYEGSASGGGKGVMG